MIRRDMPAADGSPAWLLIRQTEHARIAGQIARSWRAGPLAPADSVEQLVEAIFHHDDGWFDWERQPQIDPATGMPRDFLEMPQTDSLAIWTRCIAKADRLGPLAAYAVAGHFCALLEHSSKTTPTAGSPAAKFLQQYAVARSEWKATWIAQNPSENTTELADQAVAWLQMFDALSLWLCCADRTTTRSLHPPIGPEVTVVPKAPGTFGLEPWPLDCEELELTIPGQFVPAGRFTSSEELNGKLDRIVELLVTLEPDGKPSKN